MKRAEDYFFFLALAFGRSVMEQWRAVRGFHFQAN
jgi:hypothetical protein